MDNKPPLLPRQSTNDVLSFTQIIADRLATGQTVWDYFSTPPPQSPTTTTSSGASESSPNEAASSTDPLSPTLPPPSSITGGFRLFGSKRQSVIIDTDGGGLPDFTNPSIASATATKDVVTPRAQKRKSFVQSFRNSMISLSQLISSSKPGKQAGASKGPPHYNILVLGSGSAPLATTLYRMSSLLPSTNKIGHYQEISGFFVAHFRSNGSFSCSPKSSMETSDTECKKSPDSFETSGGNNHRKEGLENIDQDQEGENLKQSTLRRSSEESEATLHNSRVQHAKDESDSSSGSDEDDKATLYQEPTSSVSTADSEVPEGPLSASANASLSVHAFSLDTTWPAPRILAQTFWFPHTHGIIYVVDATRKNDPRGMDHLLSARQLLASLVSDPHFKRKDTPVVVFANKAGLDDETCFRVDEIADILGCEDWDDGGRVSLKVSDLNASAGSPAQRPWCVKSTRSDGDGEGLRESVEWLKSRMGEVWKF
ncbi:hypothetical protein BGZ65_002066 [Modicella reniformis]|uniref:Uncharacterized protein n=1 Tax=Modicella reniformis TaxID=1440133 RepID=A0A9P6LTY7_9FUNG|nr:hypothetical protein BGZ65_002066 [Modicella reniformis]